MRVYFISGLGADERAFQGLRFPDTWQIAHLRWPAVSPDETIPSYALKFLPLIDLQLPFAIIGFSFGGMMATELAKLIKPHKIILLSSVSTRQEFPFVFKLASALRLNRLVPNTFLNKVYPFTYWYFGVKSRDEKRLLAKIIHDTSPKFLKWAIHEILHWQNTVRPANIYHIHGSADHIFPSEKVNADFVVEDGGHFMVYSLAEKISKLLIEQIER